MVVQLRCTAPRSQAPLRRTIPRWSRGVHPAPAPSAGLPGAGNMVAVGPPLAAGLASRGFAAVTPAMQLVDPSRDVVPHCRTWDPVPVWLQLIA